MARDLVEYGGVGGRWKVAHYAVKRAFAPTLLSLVIRSEERKHLHGRTTVDYLQAELHAVHDQAAPMQASLVWNVRLVEGKALSSGEVKLSLPPLSCLLAHAIPLAEFVREYGPENLLIDATLSTAGEVSRAVAFLVQPKELNLSRAPIQCYWISPGTLELRCDSLRHGVWIEHENPEVIFSDNGFDLLPGEPRVITMEPRLAEQRIPMVTSLL